MPMSVQVLGRKKIFHSFDLQGEKKLAEGWLWHVVSAVIMDPSFRVICSATWLSKLCSINKHSDTSTCRKTHTAKFHCSPTAGFTPIWLLFCVFFTSALLHISLLCVVHQVHFHSHHWTIPCFLFSTARVALQFYSRLHLLMLLYAKYILLLF